MDVDNAEVQVQRKGRGFKGGEHAGDDIDAAPEASASSNTQTNPSKVIAAKSIEGWIVIVTGVHEEATEEDVQDKFSEYGEIKNLHLNLDRRTGYVKGYALVEYEKRSQAEDAIKDASGSTLLDQTIQCDFAFVKPPTLPQQPKAASQRRGRSASPPKQPLKTRID